MLTRDIALVDTPLARRRREMAITQAELARRCGGNVSTMARYEQGIRIPRGERLDCLIRETGLPAYALVRPLQFLQDHPEFLIAFAQPPRGRGRPRRPPSL